MCTCTVYSCTRTVYNCDIRGGGVVVVVVRGGHPQGVVGGYGWWGGTTPPYCSYLTTVHTVQYVFFAIILNTPSCTFVQITKVTGYVGLHTRTVHVNYTNYTYST